MNLKVDQEIKSQEIEIGKYMPFYYAGASGDFNPIHIDDEFAKNVGLGGIILQGLCTMALACKMVIGDEDPEKIKRFNVRFRQVVRPLDRLHLEGKIIESKGNLSTVDFVVINQKGDQVITNGQAVVGS